MLDDFTVQLQFVVLEREQAAEQGQEIDFADCVSCLRRLEGEPGLRENRVREEGNEPCGARGLPHVISNAK